MVTHPSGQRKYWREEFKGTKDQTVKKAEKARHNMGEVQSAALLGDLRFKNLNAHIHNLFSLIFTLQSLAMCLQALNSSRGLYSYTKPRVQLCVASPPAQLVRTQRGEGANSSSTRWHGSKTGSRLTVGGQTRNTFNNPVNLFP